MPTVWKLKIWRFAGNCKELLQEGKNGSLWMQVTSISQRTQRLNTQIWQWMQGNLNPHNECFASDFVQKLTTVHSLFTMSVSLWLRWEVELSCIHTVPDYSFWRIYSQLHPKSRIILELYCTLTILINIVFWTSEWYFDCFRWHIPRVVYFKSTLVSGIVDKAKAYYILIGLNVYPISSTFSSTSIRDFQIFS